MFQEVHWVPNGTPIPLIVAVIGFQKMRLVRRGRKVRFKIEKMLPKTNKHVFLINIYVLFIQ